MASPYASPVLVLVAALAILEGYRWLRVLPPDELRPSAVLFAAIAVPLSNAVTGGGFWGRRLEARAVSGASLLLIAVTAIALIIPRSPVSQLMGSTDLLFAVCALVVVLVNERFTDRSRQAARRRQASGE